jgi:hypothetical protein
MATSSSCGSRASAFFFVELLCFAATLAPSANARQFPREDGTAGIADGKFSLSWMFGKPDGDGQGSGTGHGFGWTVSHGGSNTNVGFGGGVGGGAGNAAAGGSSAAGGVGVGVDVNINKDGGIDVGIGLAEVAPRVRTTAA